MIQSGMGKNQKLVISSGIQWRNRVIVTMLVDEYAKNDGIHLQKINILTKNQYISKFVFGHIYEYLRYKTNVDILNKNKSYYIEKIMFVNRE
jgi:hypothetical protein